MNRSKIEWCDHTWNPITGCRHGCKYCYANHMVKRFAGDTRLNIMAKKIIGWRHRMMVAKMFMFWTSRC